MTAPVDLNAIIAGSPFGRFLAIEAKVDERGVLAILPVRDELVGHASRSQQLAAQGLDVDGIAQRVRQLLGLEGGSIPFRRPVSA